MNDTPRRIVLTGIIVLIMGAIYFLEETKVEDTMTDKPIATMQESTNADGQMAQEEEYIAQSSVVDETLEEALDPATVPRREAKASKYPSAIELVNPEGYINTPSITIQEHIGKNIILVDFWTYSCINCQRTTPYLNAWHEMYGNQGLVIIGVHTPEFSFEKEYVNLQKAVEKFGIKYPVVQDNDKETWRAYKNRYWPRKYLIDIDGFIVYDHIGEGAYSETEMKIKELLKERMEVKEMAGTLSEEIVRPVISDIEFSSIDTPEIYFGYDFQREQMGNVQGWEPEATIDYMSPKSREKNLFYLDGTWKNNPDNMQLEGDTGKISIKYHAKIINMVAGSDKPVEIHLSIDGQEQKAITISDHTLYTLHESDTYEDHEITITAMKPGLQAYTFTFG